MIQTNPANNVLQGTAKRLSDAVLGLTAGHPGEPGLRAGVQSDLPNRRWRTVSPWARERSRKPYRFPRLSR